MDPIQASCFLTSLASSLEGGGRKNPRKFAASMRLFLALLDDGKVPQDVLEAFRSYLDDAVEDHAYVNMDDFIGSLDFYGLLDEDEVNVDWDNLIEQVSDEFALKPEKGRGGQEWDVSRVNSSPLRDRNDYR